MFFSFKNISIRYKITLLVVTACLLTLAAGFSIALTNDINILEQDFEDLTETKAKLIGEYAISPLSFHDKKGSYEILKKASETLDFRSIELYDENGNLFSKIGKTDPIPKLPEHIVLTSDTSVYFHEENEIKFSHVIVHNKHVFGYLILHVSTLKLKNEIKRDIYVLIASAILILIIGGILFHYAQLSVSNPIFKLISYLNHVSEDTNTHRTVHVTRKDEIGKIYQAINKLLNKIQERSDERDNYFNEIKDNNIKLGNTLEAFSDGYWEYNIKENAWYFSDEWLKTFGYRREQLDTDNKSWESLIHPDDLENYNINFNQHLAGNSTYFDSEFRMLGKKGGYRWVQFKGKWVEKEKNVITRLLGITNDFQLEKENEQLVITTNKREINDQKLQAMSQMISGISHRLKNILNPIYGYADLGLMTLEDNERLRHELELIKASASNANTIIEDLLSFTGANNIQKSRIDILKTIKRICRDFKTQKDVHLKLETTITTATIIGDSKQLKQAFSHIIDNAIQASHENENVLIKIDYLEINQKNKPRYKQVPTGEYVSATIQDFGHGIEEQVFEHIFEPFFTTKEIGKGIGLGLSVAKGVINSHNGFIFINSEHYKGTSVQVLLPVL